MRELARKVHAKRAEVESLAMELRGLESEMSDLRRARHPERKPVSYEQASRIIEKAYAEAFLTVPAWREAFKVFDRPDISWPWPDPNREHNA